MSHFRFKTSGIVIYFQKGPVERDSQQLNDQKSHKPGFRNTIPNFLPGCDAILDSSIGGEVLGISQQSRSPILCMWKLAIFDIFSFFQI